MRSKGDSRSIPSGMTEGEFYFEQNVQSINILLKKLEEKQGREEFVKSVSTLLSKLSEKADRQELVTNINILNSKLDRHCPIVQEDPEFANPNEQWILYTPAAGLNPETYQLSIKGTDGTIRRLQFT